MVQRLSTLFVRTLRDNPADAEVPSHRLLVRAGYIRRAAPGGYTWLPLGYRVFQNVARVIREEMDAIGAQEVNFPAMLPKEPYEVTGRWDDYGDNIFRLKDRKDADYLLAPTHEEVFTLLVKPVPPTRISPMSSSSILVEVLSMCPYWRLGMTLSK